MLLFWKNCHFTRSKDIFMNIERPMHRATLCAAGINFAGKSQVESTAMHVLDDMVFFSMMDPLRGDLKSE